MRCPYCEHVFPLTWKRYFKATSGRHVCPNCSKHLRIEFSFFYSAILFVVLGVCAAPGAIILSYRFGGYWPVLGVIPSIFVICPLSCHLSSGMPRRPALAASGTT